ncbi:hypothetical protein ACRALDRAFT_1067707 [Sodiomyces alcalophilus JCM 7366]|uniref:uncharacterized protein n=1 Tax=Sodiomyces alcalophilus JCM 7366 TaxID=591952 RepID=UPI0039B65E4C
MTTHHSTPSDTRDVRTSPINAIFIGAGAVGCFYASRLHHPDRNVRVSLVARSNYQAIAECGVQLHTHSFGDYTFKPHAVFPDVKAAAQVTDDNPGHASSSSPPSSSTPTQHAPATTRWDYIFVTTKALPDHADDSATIAPLVGPTSCIVLIQNGVGVEDPYRKRFPANPIVSAVTVVSAEQTSPGVVRQNRWTRISLGPYTDGLGSDNGGGNADLARNGTRHIEQLRTWWGPGWGGIRDVDAHDEVGLQTVRWHKLCINSAFNPSAVLSGGRGNADMLTDPELRAHLLAVMREIWDAVPRILGRPFPDTMASPERIVRSTERNAGARPSMLLDWDAARPLELEVILGNPVRIARARGVDLPRLQTLYALLRSAQKMRAAQVGQEGKSKL